MVTLRRKRNGTGQPHWHYQLIFENRNLRTFCGLEVHSQWLKLTRFMNDTHELAICGCCADAVARLTKEIRETEAV